MLVDLGEVEIVIFSDNPDDRAATQHIRRATSNRPNIVETPNKTFCGLNTSTGVIDVSGSDLPRSICGACFRNGVRGARP